MPRSNPIITMMRLKMAVYLKIEIAGTPVVEHTFEPTRAGDIANAIRAAQLKAVRGYGSRGHEVLRLLHRQ